jgi:hypothetical protein
MWSHRILVVMPSETRDLGFRMAHEGQDSSSLRFSECQEDRLAKFQKEGPCPSVHRSKIEEGF